MKKKPPVLSDEQLEQIYEGERQRAYEFSEKYGTTLSPSNWNPNRPADRQRCFNTTHRDTVQRATAQAQRDTDYIHEQNTIREIFEEADKSCPHEHPLVPELPWVRRCSICWQSLKSKYLKEE